jgi:hypothetical protein
LCAAEGAAVILEAPSPLVPLLKGLEGVSQVIASGQPLPPFDCHTPLMSLPLAFGTTLDSVPSPKRYLKTDPDQVRTWQQRLEPRQRPRVGITWSGNPNNPIDERRSVRLADWLEYLPPDFEYFCLQTQVRELDAAALSASPVKVFNADLLNFADTAALGECLDAVLTVDTSIAHLMGALGRPTGVLLAHVPDWRWMREREDSPWYASMKLYRQRRAGDWPEVFKRSAQDLVSRFA